MRPSSDANARDPYDLSPNQLVAFLGRASLGTPISCQGFACLPKRCWTGTSDKDQDREREKNGEVT